MRTKKKFRLDDVSLFKQKSLRWAQRFRHFSYLNGNNLPYLNGSFFCSLAVSDEPSVVIDSPDRLKSLSVKKDYCFGHMGYGFANEDYHQDQLGFKESEWFFPDTILNFYWDKVEIDSIWMPDAVMETIMRVEMEDLSHERIDWKVSDSKEEYITKIENLKKHLFRGNIYQVNFCVNFFATDVRLDPVSIYEKLNEASSMPFSALLKLDDRYILSASPERYLTRRQTKLISQPMKGTAPRGVSKEEDEGIMKALFASEKERAENIMIVDLVRNDLSQVCKAGSVKVESLCEIVSYTSVHQMVSTVVGTVSKRLSLQDIVKATFPMGSMTGAPKIRAMELIDEFESQKRGAFSGALGYLAPNGDFDFNVLIRSVFYNAKTLQASYSVGSGITVLSDPEEEYKECLLKAKTIQQVLGN